ncbi:extracellular solute-binding protein [Pseudonocardia alni]|uniref:extracellular solute-binding protein n=1 Tax=Pseudonocardia alni TaxID=33907 RepID=UPI0033CC4F9D
MTRPSRTRVLRRSLLATALVAPLLLTACAGAPPAAPGADGSLAGRQLVFTNYGGAGLQAAEEKWLAPFAERTGVRYATDSPTDNAKIATMVESGSTTWDVVHGDAGTGKLECGRLFEKRPASFDMSRVDPRYVTDDCGVPIWGLAIGLTYNKKLFGANPPTSLTDFMDTERFPGKRITFNYPTGQLEALLAATGKAPDEIYPIDWAAAEAAVRTLGPDLSLQSTAAQQGTAQESGDFAMCLCLLGRTGLAIGNGADVGVVWDRIWVGWDDAYVVKGTRSPDAAWAFMQFLATPESGAVYEVLPYSPTTLDTHPAVRPEFEQVMPQFNQDEIRQTYDFDVQWWADNQETAMAEWTRITAG